MNERANVGSVPCKVNGDNEDSSIVVNLSSKVQITVMTGATRTVPMHSMTPVAARALAALLVTAADTLDRLVADAYAARRPR